LDHKRQRIALSLKRLQLDPWDLVDTTYSEGQLVSGTVSSVTDFGAFVALDIGVEGLVHISELADPPPQDPQQVVQPGDESILRVLRIDSYRQRIGLSLKEVSKEERDRWLAEQTEEPDVESEEEQTESSSSASTSDNGKVASGWVEPAEETTSDEEAKSAVQETSLEAEAL
jgi:ribosomal protein S1